MIFIPIFPLAVNYASGVFDLIRRFEVPFTGDISPLFP